MIALPIEELPEAAPTLAIGAAAPGFEGLLGVDGRRYGSSTWADAEAVVLAFTSNRCPTVKAYAGRLEALRRDLEPRGVRLAAINSNDPRLYPDEAYERMVERAREDGYRFPYLADPDQSVARAYGARCTFHLFLLDRARRLRYQGRFDDARLEERVTRHDLRDALEDVLAGRAVRTPVTRPFGCSLDLV